MGLPLILATAIVVVGAFFAGLLHDCFFPFAEPHCGLALDEHLHELAATRRTHA